MESSRTVLDIQVDFFSVRPAKESKELEASGFLLGVVSTLLPYAMIIPDRWLFLWDVLNLRVSTNTKVQSFVCYQPHFC